MNNTALLRLYLSGNRISGAEGGQQVGLVLQHCPNLKMLNLDENGNFGSLGACAMAPGLAVAHNLEDLALMGCRVGINGASGLIPEGQVNTSLITLDLYANPNDIESHVDGENMLALAARCTNLDRLFVNVLNPDHIRRLNLLMDRKRLCTEAQALAGSTFPILFQFVEERAHCHEHGLSAIFIILQNDGDDYFCNANNRTNP